MTTGSDETLDPHDWDAFRVLAHRMVDDMLDVLEGLREGPPWRAMSDDVKATFREPVPREGAGAEAAYRVFKERVLPYTNGNRHPRFFGWVQGNSTPLGMMADMLAAGMNPHCAGFEQASTYVELQVLAWLRELMGFPADASGILLGGGTMANFVGLAAARDARAGWDVWNDGMQGPLGEPGRGSKQFHQSKQDRDRLVFYGSTELHGWAPKAANLLGLGQRAFRAIEVDASYRIRIDKLEEAIAEDRARGMRGFCVVATAGTVNTGATDDLMALAKISRAHDLWFHVDGAFGAWARLSSCADKVRGIELADSLAFDLHKWGYLPFEIACVLVRDAEAHRRPFSIAGNYIEGAERGVFSAGLPFADRCIDLTRSFKALKVWLSFKAQGADRLGRMIDQNIAQARRLEARVRAHPDLECVAPVELNVVCFRVHLPGISERRLNRLNREVWFRLQEEGIAVPSSTTLRGRFALRAAFVNHRTRFEDVDALAEHAARLGRRILEDGILEDRISGDDVPEDGVPEEGELPT